MTVIIINITIMSITFTITIICFFFSNANLREAKSYSIFDGSLEVNLRLSFLDFLMRSLQGSQLLSILSIADSKILKPTFMKLFNCN